MNDDEFWDAAALAAVGRIPVDALDMQDRGLKYSTNGIADRDEAHRLFPSAQATVVANFADELLRERRERREARERSHDSVRKVSL
jgi:hypothetical protein